MSKKSTPFSESCLGAAIQGYLWFWPKKSSKFWKFSAVTFKYLHNWIWYKKPLPIGLCFCKKKTWWKSWHNLHWMLDPTLTIIQSTSDIHSKQHLPSTHRFSSDLYPSIPQIFSLVGPCASSTLLLSPLLLWKIPFDNLQSTTTSARHVWGGSWVVRIYNRLIPSLMICYLIF